MNRNFEKMLANVIHKQCRQVKKRDPCKNKLYDHRKRFKKRKARPRYRAFRAKNNQFCRELVTKTNLDEIVEPVFKKTGE